MTAEEMWNKFSALTPDAKEYTAWAFGGGSKEVSDSLARLVLDGTKTATASAYPLYEYDKEPLPETGQYSVILNSRDQAMCIIRTTRVSVAPFSSVTAEHAYKEGEFDRSLAEWRKCHKAVFTADLEEAGLEFFEDMPVVCEEFEVVYR